MLLIGTVVIGRTWAPSSAGSALANDTPMDVDDDDEDDVNSLEPDSVWRSLSQGQGRRSKKGRKCVFPQCKHRLPKTLVL